MKFVDFGELLDIPPVRLALLSTFQFDPDFFERRVLPTSALHKARRIVVFMDQRQWARLMQQDFQVKHLNRRYLLVPVHRASGVFHPKLNLLISPLGARVLCGSNNLTRAGCSSNLELLSSFDANQSEKTSDASSLAIDSFRFFRRVCDDAESSFGAIARDWLDEISKEYPWILSEVTHSKSQKIKLIHTFDGSIWGRLSERLSVNPPKRLLIISPYYDKESELVIRFAKKWPKCKIELVVQQSTTTLNVGPFKKFGSQIHLSELRNSVRRLHAKLVAWQSAEGSGCLVGSANVTLAAFDARNVEASLLIDSVDSEMDGLFDRNLDKRPLKMAEFEPGTESEPESLTDPLPDLRVTAAILHLDGQLRLTYKHSLAAAPSSMRVAIKASGEPKPRLLLSIPASATSTIVGIPDAGLADVHGPLLAWLVAEIGGTTKESSPIWVAQEAHLTYESSGEASSSSGSKIEETGEGLAEFIEELGRREGPGAVVEYLRNFNIRYSESGYGPLGSRPFILRVRDPFRGDTTPEWVLRSGLTNLSLAEALYDFADRHEYQRLRKHAQKGNINSVENYLNILVAVVRLLYIYYLRGVVTRPELLSRLIKYMGISTDGYADPDDASAGYLSEVSENMDGDLKYLREAFDGTEYLAHVWAIYLLARAARTADKKALPLHGSNEYLPGSLRTLRRIPHRPGLSTPTPEALSGILLRYNMFGEGQISSVVGAYHP